MIVDSFFTEDTSGENHVSFEVGFVDGFIEGWNIKFYLFVTVFDCNSSV